jgi:hypothetical protein
LLKITAKVVSLLKVADRAVPNPADIYLGIKDLHQHVAGLKVIEGFLLEEDLQMIERSFLNREYELDNVFLGAAYHLDPRYVEHEINEDAHNQFILATNVIQIWICTSLYRCRYIL